MVLLISPWKLFNDSILAGVVFSLAVLTFALDVTIISLRSYSLAYVQGFKLDNAFGLSFGIACSIVWHMLVVCLLLDLMSTLLIPSRTLQRGTVISFGIVSVFQIPLSILFLLNEMSPTNRLWLLVACIDSKYSNDCVDWLETQRLAVLVPVGLNCVLHLVVLGSSAYYVEHRAATVSQLLVVDEDARVELERIKQRKRDKAEAKKTAKDEKKAERKRQSEARRAARNNPVYLYHSVSGSEDSDPGYKKPGSV
ncbi:uncharacterized protein JCM15063_005751 [Sporobolomyces koalae]|uniref:uncharacterized protein n=1 Tax=Sporobolomyces koalae TaxID=500713 RepID=UPI00317976BA